MTLLIPVALLAVAPASPPDPRVFGADAIADCDTDLHYLNQVLGWQVVWPRQWSNPEERAKWSRVPEALAGLTAKLKARSGAGLAPKPVVRRVLQQVETLAQNLEARSPGHFENADTEWQRLLTAAVAPAIRRFATFLETEYLPKAPNAPGLHHLPNGRGCFRAATRWWTSSDLDPDAIRALGKELLAEKRLALGHPFPRRLNDLRTPRASTGDELVARSHAAIDRARRESSSAFRWLPVASLDVVPISEHLRDSAPAGYYRPGAKPAYVINTSRPSERRLMVEVIAFHEGIPGHHLFAAYPRRGTGGSFNAGLAEGWAIYAEALADELDLYSSEYDRRGMIAKHLWAASRLIVEPGLHLDGWSRQRAIDFMREVTALPLAEIEIEVDRYIAMPGQSLAYMLGYAAIRDARRAAEKRLGARFDLAGFHDAVLARGHRSLPEMRKDVTAWVEGVIAADAKRPRNAAR